MQLLGFIAILIAILIFSLLSVLNFSDKRKSKSRKLADKFEDLLNWKVGDTIRYTDKYDMNNVCKIAIFKEDGIYGFDSSYWYDNWIANRERGYNDFGVDKMIFVPTELIQENVDIEERNRYIDVTSELDDDYSYHNQLVTIQDEYRKLNNEFNLSNRVKE